MGNQEEWAWVAGFFEGEGSVILARATRRPGLRRPTPQPIGYQRRLEITNTERDVLERVVAIAGFGTVYAERLAAPPTRKKQRLYWSIGRWQLIDETIHRVYPFLGSRRRAAVDRMLSHAPTHAWFESSDGRRVRRAVQSAEPDPVRSQPTAAEWAAWAAGVFEGEGSAICRPMSVRRRGLQRRLQVPMSDRDVLEQLRLVLGAGTVRPTTPRTTKLGTPRKPMYIWRACRWADIERISNAFYPYLGSKRRRQVDVLLSNPAGLGGYKSWTHCARGHPITGGGADVYRYGNARQCRLCHALNYRERIDARRRLATKAQPLPSGNKTMCVRGHPLIGPYADVYVYFGWRQCRPCQRIARATRQARRATAS